MILRPLAEGAEAEPLHIHASRGYPSVERPLPHDHSTRRLMRCAGRDVPYDHATVAPAGSMVFTAGAVRLIETPKERTMRVCVAGATGAIGIRLVPQPSNGATR
jgi:hypothetical protein